MASYIVILSVVLASLHFIGAAHYQTQRRKQVSPQNPYQQRQIQQWQVAVQYPQGSRVKQGNALPPGPAAPGHVWIQVPISEAAHPAAPTPQQPQNPTQYPSPPQWAPQPGNQPIRPLPGTFNEEELQPEQHPDHVGTSEVYPAEVAVPPVEQVGEGGGGDHIEVVEENVWPGTGEGEVQPGTGGGEEVNPLFRSCREARGQFPSETACNKFVNCWDDVVVEQQCPGNLAFSEKGFCDYPDNVDCGNRVSEKAPGIGESGQCPTPYGLYRSTTSCGLFYMCDNFRPVLFECPVGLNFNSELNVCDYPYHVDCGGVPSERPVPEVEETTDEPEALVEPPPALAPETPYAPEQPAAGEGGKKYHGLKRIPASAIDARVPCRSNSVFRLNPACTSVSLCRRGYSTTVNCAPGTAWDSKSQGCINVYKARC